MEKTSSGKLYDVTLKPFETAFNGTLVLIGMSYGVAILISPLIFLGYLIYGYIEGFRGLF